MIADEVRALVARELASFVPPPAEAHPDAVGRPWGPERYAARVAELRAALVDPVPVELRSYERPGVGAAWLIAREADGTVVAYDPELREFALANLGADGAAWEVEVRGDLVSTFCAA